MLKRWLRGAVSCRESCSHNSGCCLPAFQLPVQLAGGMTCCCCPAPTPTLPHHSALFSPDPTIASFLSSPARSPAPPPSPCRAASWWATPPAWLTLPAPWAPTSMPTWAAPSGARPAAAAPADSAAFAASLFCPCPCAAQLCPALPSSAQLCPALPSPPVSTHSPPCAPPHPRYPLLQPRGLQVRRHPEGPLRPQ